MTDTASGGHRAERFSISENAQVHVGNIYNYTTDDSRMSRTGQLRGRTDLLPRHTIQVHDIETGLVFNKSTR